MRFWVVWQEVLWGRGASHRLFEWRVLEGLLGGGWAGGSCLRAWGKVVLDWVFKHLGLSSPTTSGCLSPLENANDVKCLFLRQRVYCNGSRGT